MKKKTFLKKLYNNKTKFKNPNKYETKNKINKIIINKKSQ